MKHFDYRELEVETMKYYQNGVEEHEITKEFEDELAEAETTFQKSRALIDAMKDKIIDPI